MQYARADVAPLYYGQVLFLTIMSQLYAPLNSFSSNYRQVRRAHGGFHPRPAHLSGLPGFVCRRRNRPMIGGHRIQTGLSLEYALLEISKATHERCSIWGSTAGCWVPNHHQGRRSLDKVVDDTTTRVGQRRGEMSS